MQSPEDILAFWLDETDKSNWYRSDDALDQVIRERFLTTWEAAMNGALSLWLTYPSGTLAYIILTDQFSRNMFRGTAKSFASDRLALAAAKAAVARKWDMRIEEPARQFFYLPLMHSECLMDQERAVRMFVTRMPKTGHGNLLDAKAHREIIRRFGRFPYRSEALARPLSQPEEEYLEHGGYRSTMQELRAAAG